MNMYFFVVVVEVGQIFPTLVPNLCWWIIFYIMHSDCALEKTEKTKYLTKSCSPCAEGPTQYSVNWAWRDQHISKGDSEGVAVRSYSWWMLQLFFLNTDPESRRETTFKIYNRSEEGQWLAGIWEGGRKVRSFCKETSDPLCLQVTSIFKLVVLFSCAN